MEDENDATHGTNPSLHDWLLICILGYGRAINGHVYVLFLLSKQGNTSDAKDRYNILCESLLRKRNDVASWFTAIENPNVSPEEIRSGILQIMQIDLCNNKDSCNKLRLLGCGHLIDQDVVQYFEEIRAVNRKKSTSLSLLSSDFNEWFCSDLGSVASCDNA